MVSLLSIESKFTTFGLDEAALCALGRDFAQHGGIERGLGSLASARLPEATCGGHLHDLTAPKWDSGIAKYDKSSVQEAQALLWAHGGDICATGAFFASRRNLAWIRFGLDRGAFRAKRGHGFGRIGGRRGFVGNSTKASCALDSDLASSDCVAANPAVSGVLFQNLNWYDFVSHFDEVDFADSDFLLIHCGVLLGLGWRSGARVPAPDSRWLLVLRDEALDHAEVFFDLGICPAFAFAAPLHEVGDVPEFIFIDVGGVADLYDLCDPYSFFAGVFDNAVDPDAVSITFNGGTAVAVFDFNACDFHVLILFEVEFEFGREAAERALVVPDCGDRPSRAGFEGVKRLAGGGRQSSDDPGVLSCVSVCFAFGCCHRKFLSCKAFCAFLQSHNCFFCHIHQGLLASLLTFFSYRNCLRGRDLQDFADFFDIFLPFGAREEAE